MACSCPKHRQSREDGIKHISCVWNGRRLPQAWEEIQLTVKDCNNLAGNVIFGMCEGSEKLARILMGMLHRTASLLEMRFMYLDEAPWCFARAGTPAGAQHCIDKLRGRPLEHQDVFVRSF